MVLASSSDGCTVDSLVEILHSTSSPVNLLDHNDALGEGIPFYFIAALEEVSGMYHPPPRTTKEDLAVEEFRKKMAPAAGNEVFSNIMIGNKAAAEDASFLASLGVTHLLNCAHVLGHWMGQENPKVYRVDPDLAELAQRGINILQLELLDESKVEICEKFQENNAWIKQALDSGGKVLVNCYQGASRSATVVLAFLIQEHKMQVEEALVAVKKKRDIRPNNGFLQQLIDFSNAVHEQH